MRGVSGEFAFDRAPRSACIASVALQHRAPDSPRPTRRSPVLACKRPVQ
jgi:hypothetical protein